MAAVHNAVIASLSSTVALYSVPYSLRFRANASARLTRTAGTPTDARKWSLRIFGKRGTVGGANALFGATNGTSAQNFNISFTASGSSSSGDFINAHFSGLGTRPIVTNSVFRDPTAPVDWLFVYDSANATAADRFIIYCDGVRQSVSGAGLTLNQDCAFNTSGSSLYLGYGTVGYGDVRDYFDGTMAEVTFVDGQALSPTAFGQVDGVSGSWSPKSYTGSYGANGYYLPFNDASSTPNITLDRSGNGNNWSNTGISITPGVSMDQLTDTPTNNFAVINPLRRMQNAAPVATWGNLRYRSGSGSYYPRGVATQAFDNDATGWYCEFTLTTAHLGVEGFGVVLGNAYLNDSNGIGAEATEWGYQGTGVTGNIKNNGVTAFSGLSLWSAGQVGQIAYRNGSLWLGINNTWFNSGNPSAGTGAVYTGLVGPLFPLCLAGSTTPVIDANFGQRAFAYTPPTGFKALNTTNGASAAVALSGAFTGNANADGPFIWADGNPATLTINGNVVTFGTHADKTAGGFKLRTASASYNQAGTNNWTATAGLRFIGTNKVPNKAQTNP